MTPQTFIFVGRSGCGKGTQADLLQKYLREKDPAGEVFYIETGANFREFVKGEKYSNQLSDSIYKTGNRQPDFLAIWMWGHVLINSFKGTEHAIFDGINRSLPEAMTFTTALEFYDRKAHIIYVNVSREWSEERLFARGREDDVKKEEVKKRLDWFEKDTLPAIEYFNVHERYMLHDINGMQSIEDVNKEIISQLGW